MRHRGADGCHANMPRRQGDWIVTKRMSGSKEEREEDDVLGGRNSHS